MELNKAIKSANARKRSEDTTSQRVAAQLPEIKPVAASSARRVVEAVLLPFLAT
jgi:hypothetical protein